MRRAGHINPFEGIRRDDAEQVVNALSSLDRDHWAAAWCKVGLAYEAKADARAKAGAAGKELAELYTLAFEYLPYRSLPRRQHAGQERGLSAFAAYVPQGGDALPTAACDRRDPVRRQDARRLPADSCGHHQAAGGHALGRGRRLEGKPPAGLGVFPSRRHRHLDGGHAGHRREPRALWRSGRRAQLFRLDRSSHATRRHRRQPHRRVGRQLRRLLGGAPRFRRGETHQGRSVSRR